MATEEEKNQALAKEAKENPELKKVKLVTVYSTKENKHFKKEGSPMKVTNDMALHLIGNGMATDKAPATK